MEMGKFAIAGAIVYAAWTAKTYFLDPLEIVDPTGTQSAQLDTAAVLINYNLDLKFGTHDPTKIPNYVQEVLLMGQALATKFGVQ